MKKGFEPVLVSPFTVGDTLKVDVINDRLTEINATLKLKMIDFDGKVLWEKTSEVTVPANASTNYFEVNKTAFLKELGNQAANSVLVCELVSEENKYHRKTVLFLNHLKI